MIDNIEKIAMMCEHFVLDNTEMLQMERPKLKGRMMNKDGVD